MVPPLKPRPRPRPRLGTENDFPSAFHQSSKSRSSKQPRRFPSTSSVLMQNHSSANHSLQQAPLSPPFPSEEASAQQGKDDESLVKTPEQQVQTAPHNSSVGQHHKHLLVDLSVSSADTSMSSNTTATNSPSDLTLTPPPSSQASLMVEAKRHGNELREANNSESRRRRRRRLSRDTEVTSVLIQATTDTNGSSHQTPTKRSKRTAASREDEHDVEQEFWLGSRNDDSSSSEDDTPLEFLTGKAALMSSEERTKKYWEWCYGKSNASSLLQQLPSTSSSSNARPGFSAKRAPPLKGW